MPYKIPQSKVKQRMAKEAAAKHGQLMQLQQEHNRLKSQHDVMMQCCDLMQWLRLQQLPADDIDMPDADCSIDITADSSYYEVDQDELHLLQQLHHLPQLVSTGMDSNTTTTPSFQNSSSSINSSINHSSWHLSAVCPQDLDSPAVSAPADSAAAAQPCATLSPADDPMQFFRTLISQPPPPRARTISLADLQDDYAATVCELSLNLAALQTAEVRAGLQEHPLDAIHRLVLRHFHMLVSMVLHRHELLMAFYASNCLTREYRETGLCEAVDQALSDVQLSPQQQQHISDIIAVFKRLVLPLVQARQQMQYSGFCGAAAYAASSRTGTATAADGDPAAAAVDEEGCSSEGSSADVFVEVQGLGWRPSLQQQQKKVSDLRTVMKKVSPG